MSESGTYLYVSQHGSQRISVLRVAQDGGLTRVQDVPVQGKVMPLAISPDRRFLYAAVREPTFTIYSFAIDGRSGELTPLSATPAFDSVVYMSTDRSGRYLLAANNPHHAHRTGILCVYAIGADGCVQAPYEMVRTPPKLHAVLPDPSNRFLFATSCDGDLVLRYGFDAATGEMTAGPLASTMVEHKRGPRHFVFHPNNRFLYLVNEYDASVYAFRHDVRDGRLSEIQVAGAAPDGFTPGQRVGGISAGAADLHFTPDGRWLYVSVRGSLTMAAFAVDPVSGLMTRAGEFAMPKEPRGFAIDPLGRYLFAAGDGSGLLSSFAIDGATGGLTPLAELEVGDGPNWVECIRLS